MVRILIADDQAVLRIGLRTVFEQTPEFSVVGQAANAAETLELAAELLPDIVLMEAFLPDRTGAETCRSILSAHPQMRVIILTAHPDDRAMAAAVEAGAAAYLLKQLDPALLIQAVRTVVDGGSVFETPAEGAAASPPAESELDPLSVLSDQEQKILMLIASGKTNREIAAGTGLSVHTVKTYVSQIFRKLHLARRAEAAASAQSAPATRFREATIASDVARSAGTSELTTEQQFETVLHGGRVLTAAGWRRTDVGIAGGRIAALGRDLAAHSEQDVRGARLLPGFIDVHVHGAGGFDVGAGTEAIRALAAVLPQMGVTSFLPTLAASSSEQTREFL